MNDLLAHVIGTARESDSPSQQATTPSSATGISDANRYGADDEDLTLRSLIAKAEVQAIRQALEHTGWNRKKAARLLRISYRGLLYKIRNRNITRAH